jgi:hypothetical protein
MACQRRGSSSTCETDVGEPGPRSVLARIGALALRHLRLGAFSIRGGHERDDGAAELARRKSAFAHLESLDVSKSLLTDRGLELVEGLCAEVITDEQRDVEDERSVAVGE